uniref:Movement protein n=1 Tax=Steinernema glaseri TaxID=37863 RepID=A0A1I8A5F1_9BILA
MTGQVGNTVSQVPHAWVFYLLFITLIVVFILLSVLLFINLFTKVHAIYTLIRGSAPNTAASSLEVTPLPTARSDFHPKPPPRYNPPRNGQVALSMETEPRRPGTFQHGLGYQDSMKQAYHQSDETLTRRSPLNMETTTGPFLTNRGQAV